MIDKATVQRIKDTANIVEVVSDYVHLQRRGANYMGLCPFHNERTPSFSVNPRRNICHCFSCGKGGSPVNFIMEKENISYYDALKQLAKKYGIKVEERELTPEERRVATEREGLLIASETAMKIMEEDLRDTPEGRDIGLAYLYQRGVTEEAIKAFHLGYALDQGSHLTSMMQRKGFDVETLKTLGLTGLSKNGNLYDKYRGRVIFPIMNSSGKTVGFGGRDLKGGAAKYINSPESVLYHKNNELYGIFQAKNEIVRQNSCFLVEGYLDVISMWQAGFKNVVASSGTSLTDGQIAVIHRFTSNITLLYDGDAAGIKAALRGIDMLLSHKMKVSVLLLPDGHDPDSFARQHTPEEFQEYVNRHSTDIIRFKMNVMMSEAGDNPLKKGEVVNSVVESIACIPEYVDRMIYVGECARKLKIDEKAIAAAVEKARFIKVEEMKNERRKREFNKNINASPTGYSQNQIPNSSSDSASQDTSTSQDVTTADTTSQTDNLHHELNQKKASSDLAMSIQRSESLRRNPMKPLEKRMIELIIKYGYINVPPNDPESGDNTHVIAEGIKSLESLQEENDYYPILDFISEELEADNVSFTTDEYKKVFELLFSSFDEFLNDYVKEKNRIISELSEKLKAEQAQIAASGGSISDIENTERKLLSELLQQYRQRIKEFARYYPSNLLASHEDDSIRKVANEVIYEKYVLSNIYATPQTGSLMISELDEVMRAITEWKSEILNLMLNDLMAELRKVSEIIDGEHTDTQSESKISISQALENMQEIQMKIASLMSMRSQVAKNIGERVLSPRNIKKL